MSKRKLLLADDSITIQKVVNLTFADEGIEVISVGDGNSAMDKLREELPDMVMADVNMPGLNGYEICEKIKNSDLGNSETPVILLVGSFEPFDEDEAKRVGADDYLTKPFQSISQLVEKVSTLLNLEEDVSLEDTAEMFVDGNSSADIVELPEPTLETFNQTTQPIEEPLIDNFVDDEMIQTAQVGSLPIDDAVKFDSTSEIPNIESEVDVSESFPDFNKTQPFTDSDLAEISIDTSEEVESEFVKEESETYETQMDSPDELNIENYQVDSTESQTDESAAEVENELPMPEAASILQLDELNLLDLPPLEGNGFDATAVEKVEIADETPDEVDNNDDYYTKLTEGIDNDIPQDKMNMIAKEVVERVAQNEVRDVAWEVVPELAELIIRKMAKEKLKD